MKKAAKIKKIVPLDPIKGRLNIALRSSGTTQAKIAKHFQITPQAVSEWFNLKKPGKCEPDRYPDLADLLSVNLVWLLCGRGSQEGIRMDQDTFNLLRRYQLLSPEGQIMVRASIDGLLSKQQAAERPKAG